MEGIDDKYAAMMLKIANAYGFKSFAYNGYCIFFDKDNGERWTLGAATKDKSSYMRVMVNQDGRPLDVVVHEVIDEWFLSNREACHYKYCRLIACHYEVSEMTCYAVDLPSCCRSLDELSVMVDLMCKNTPYAMHKLTSNA